ncbi:MAG: hypothetical protein O7D91_21450 [Planctomycetota bacterium]|nr:hypothetical protein [Planctomycetota bacterium]
MNICKCEACGIGLPCGRDHDCEYEGPGVLRKGVNLARAVASHIGGGGQYVTPAASEARLTKCRTGNDGQPCDFYRAGHYPTCQHAKCGCYLHIKATWAKMSCPIGWW